MRSQGVESEALCSSGTRLVLFLFKEEKELERRKKFHVRGVEKASCQHVQVVMTHLRQNIGNGRR